MPSWPLLAHWTQHPLADPLETLIRLRRQSQDQAQTALARAISTACMTDRAMRDAQDAIRAEQDAASSLTADDGAVEAFARWLPAARVRVDAMAYQAERAQAEIGRVRALLTACRTALESVEELAASRAAMRAKARQLHHDRALSEYLPKP